jgi:hypothetical protein
MLKNTPGVGLFQHCTIHYCMTEDKMAIAGKISVHDFDEGINKSYVVLPRQSRGWPYQFWALGIRVPMSSTGPTVLRTI